MAKQLTPTKWQAIKSIITASNWMVYTDNVSLGRVSPLYADAFIQKTDRENERLRLLAYKHDAAMDELAANELDKTQ